MADETEPVGVPGWQTCSKTKQRKIGQKLASRFLGAFPTFRFGKITTRTNPPTLASLRSKLDSAGTPIGPHDTPIAAMALRHGATLDKKNPTL